MNFKEVLEDDLSTVFFSLDEFAEIHNVNGRDISIVIDDNKLKENKMKVGEGTYVGDVLFYTKKSNFDDKPVKTERMLFDSEIYRVSDIEEDMEMYIITLEAFMS